MLLGGVALGLAIAFIDLPTAAPVEEAGPAPTADPYAEARRSRAILEAQEGPPPAATRATGIAARGGAAMVTARFARCGSGRWETCIIDGDTFVLNRQRIRIADIDTPEMKGRCPSEIRLAHAATDRMAALLSAGPFALERLGDRDTDRYGRQLRVVTRDGRSLGDQLVAEGLARTWGGRREPWC